MCNHRRSPNHKSPSEKGESWLSLRLPAHTQERKPPHSSAFFKFPEARGKIIAEVELSLTPDYNVIEVVFEDKTSLTFNVESCFQITPEIVSWKSGSYKPRKRWRSVHSV